MKKNNDYTFPKGENRKASELIEIPTPDNKVVIKAGTKVFHKIIRKWLTVAPDENGPAYTGNEFADDEISLSHAINEYENGNLNIDNKGGSHTRKIVDYVIEKVDEQFDSEIPKLKAENEKLKEDNRLLLEALNNVIWNFEGKEDQLSKVQARSIYYAKSAINKIK